MIQVDARQGRAALFQSKSGGRDFGRWYTHPDYWCSAVNLIGQCGAAQLMSLNDSDPKNQSHPPIETAMTTI
jgi:hypothetical protein